MKHSSTANSRCALNQTKTFSIALPALRRFTLKDIQNDFPWIRAIERDTSPEESVALVLSTVLGPDETRIRGNEYELRLVPQRDALLGYQHCLWLRDNQQSFPALYELFGQFCIDFPGTVVVHDRGGPDIPYLAQDGIDWDISWYWNGWGFSTDDLVAIAKK
jgi:hypothetical protein